jgi:hypothetical protein
LKSTRKAMKRLRLRSARPGTGGVFNGLGLSVGERRAADDR